MSQAALKINDFDNENIFVQSLPILRKKISDGDYKSWIKDLTFARCEDTIVYLSAPNSFVREWIDVNYSYPILCALQSIDERIKFVRIEENSVPHAPVISHAEQEPEVNAAEASAEEEIKESAFDPIKTFENFVVGKPNEFAHAAALRVAESETPVYNPLFLYGGVGLGKTHLMHAIGLRMRKLSPQKRILYISAEKFMYRFITALRHKDMVAFKDEFRNIDVLMIDDVQFFSTKTTTQEEFFHTFNALIDSKKQIILSADKSPKDLEHIEERLKSRMGWGLVADIHPTTYELRLSILWAKAAVMGVRLPEDVLQFMAAKMSTSNIREIEGAMNRINAHASLINREIDVDAAKEILGSLVKHDSFMTIDHIKKKVGEYFGVKVREIDSAKRMKGVTQARQIAMYFCRILLDKSFPVIGREFGGKDHSSVLYSVDKVKELMNKDLAYAEELVTLQNIIEAHP